MKHPVIVNANANLRLNQMLQEAEAHRQVKRVTAQKPGRNLLNELKERIPILKGQGLDESANLPA